MYARVTLVDVRIPAYEPPDPPVSAEAELPDAASVGPVEALSHEPADLGVVAGKVLSLASGEVDRDGVLSKPQVKVDHGVAVNGPACNQYPGDVRRERRDLAGRKNREAARTPLAPVADPLVLPGSSSTPRCVPPVEVTS